MDCHLRALIENDMDMIYNWRNLESIRENMFHDQMIPYKDHCNWFRNVLINQAKYYRLFVNQNKPLGLVSFKESNQQSQTCLWGFYIGESTAPKGSGTIMGSLALDYAFQCLSMRKVIGEVLSTNQKSTKFHLKLGFIQTGLDKNKLWRNGQPVDILQFQLDSEEWDRQKAKVN
ncbi:UDP-4-amino-4,6-dideoxy-N-acetyl-beta-L-altrosamine N-acetyltransferase [Peribacillus sp. NPDC056705]|uniref:UDP-4-amino-4, 6-dideoxy-N-acetyl-beta-L-altrosamine N-acetyltransferase n=1 Tax=Peribacillus sp. NPDC056705 TaxID=3345918 RepID=UPI003748DFB8